MKRLILVIIIALVVIGFGTRFVYALPSDAPYNQRYMMNSNYGCHGGSYERQYEWYYLHLSEDNQDLLDLMFAEEIALYNLDDLTTLEQKELIKEIKERLVEYILDEDLIEYGRP